MTLSPSGARAGNDNGGVRDGTGLPRCKKLCDNIAFAHKSPPLYRSNRFNGSYLILLCKSVEKSGAALEAAHT